MRIPISEPGCSPPSVNMKVNLGWRAPAGMSSACNRHLGNAQYDPEDYQYELELLRVTFSDAVGILAGALTHSPPSAGHPKQYLRAHFEHQDPSIWPTQQTPRAARLAEPPPPRRSAHADTADR